jgi:predicted flap endonuclease-1-like 5' DNA nuclease
MTRPKEMIMSSLGCCIWWFLFGALLGWLASWLIGRLIGKGETEPVRALGAHARHADGIDPAAARAAGYLITGPENLEIIEGIGPSIAHLLRSNGVGTFTQLAGASAAAIQAILDSAGPRFKLANPQTWAEQAALAAANRWGELRLLQDSLVAGLPRP